MFDHTPRINLRILHKQFEELEYWLGQGRLDLLVAEDDDLHDLGVDVEDLEQELGVAGRGDGGGAQEGGYVREQGVE